MKVKEVMTFTPYRWSKEANLGEATELHVALLTMREGKVRRPPVVDSEGRAVGVLSIDDVLLRAEPSGSGKIVELSTDEGVRSFRVINQRELPQVVKKQSAAA